MNQIYSIQNGSLSVSASTQGAELRSIRDSSGTEYLWQGDPAYWTDRSPVLFPYVGRLTGGKYVLDGNTYQMKIHGIALYLPFALVEHGPSSMTFQLQSDEGTLGQYPRAFCFLIRYFLEESTLYVEYTVENLSDKTMYFGLGGHPGFRVPLEPGLAFEDYDLRFCEKCAPTRVGFGKTCLRNGADAPFSLTEDQILPLRHDLFDDDAIVLADIPRQITLEAPGGRRSITVSFPQMPYLGIWHAPGTDAPYVCIEPWCSLPAWQDKIPVLEEQEDLLSLSPGQCYQNTWHIHIHRP